MNAAQKLARRAERRERQIVGAFLDVAETAGMTPAQVAASAVVVYADIRTKPVRVWAYNLNPAPELRTIGPRVTFACDRARLLELWGSDASTALSAEDADLTGKLQSPPPPGFFWLLCLAGAPGERTFSWSLSKVAWSVYGAASANGCMSREEALAAWHAAERGCPGFWDRWPRDAAGPVTDDERVEMVRDAWEFHLEKRGAN